jgi:hypothetical protein
VSVVTDIGNVKRIHQYNNKSKSREKKVGKKERMVVRVRKKGERNNISLSRFMVSMNDEKNKESQGRKKNC